MKLGFTDEIRIICDTPVDREKLDEVASRIASYYDVRYHYTLTENGFVMKPKGEFSMYRNSFWPVLEGKISDGVLALRRRIIYLAYIWFGFAAFFQVLLLILLGNTLPENLAVLIPSGIALFGYVLCKIGSELSGRPVLKCAEAVLKEKPTRSEIHKTNIL